MNVEDLLHPLLKTYLNAPQWVKSSVGRAYASVPLSWRRGRHYQRFVAEAALQGEHALRALARAKLAATLQHALRTVPAYRPWRALAQDLHDPYPVLRCLPLLSKEELKRDLERYLSRETDPDLRLKIVTGGSTSVPMTLYLHKGVTRAKEYAYIEAFHRRAGMSGGEVVLAIRGDVVPGAAQGGSLYAFEPIKQQLMFSTEHLSPAHMPQLVEAMRRFKPRYVQAYPSAAYPLALWLKQHPDQEVVKRIEGVMLFSENVLDHHLTLLRQVFDCPVVRHYGHSERVLMGASMPDDDRYFFWPQYGYLELVDASGRRIDRPGELGEIVGTSFDNGVMPLLRYRTGDMGVLSDGGHPLLPGFVALERIEGRMQEFVVCLGPRLVSINGITAGAQHKLLEFAQAIQFEQREIGRLRMHIVMPRRLESAELSSIAHSVQQRMGADCSVEAFQVDSVQRTGRGKTLMLIQHLDVRPYFGGADTGVAR